jgi:Protein of unknown function (DUF3833)
MQDGGAIFSGEGGGAPERLAEVGPDGTKFDPVSFFTGAVRAHGVFEDRFGRMQRRFSIEMTGVPSGPDGAAVEETLWYDDGSREHRTWRVDRDPSGGFSLTGEDFVGIVRGLLSGSSAEMGYVYRLRVGGRIVFVRMRDRLHRVTSTHVMNRITMRKFGVRLGEIAACFQKV